MKQTWALGISAVDVEQVVEQIARPVEALLDAAEFSCSKDGILVVSANVQICGGRLAQRMRSQIASRFSNFPATRNLTSCCTNSRSGRYTLQVSKRSEPSKRVQGWWATSSIARQKAPRRDHMCSRRGIWPVVFHRRRYHTRVLAADHRFGHISRPRTTGHSHDGQQCDGSSVS